MLLLIAKIVLGPFFLYQAFKLRKNIIILPDPSGPVIGKVGSGPDLRLLLVGDSGAMGVGVETQDLSLKGRLVHRLKSYFCVNFEIKAKTGFTSKDTLKLLRSIEPQEFDIAVVSLGVNDITTGITRLGFIRAQTELIKLLKGKFKIKQVILSGFPPIGKFPVLPQPSRWFVGETAKVFDKVLKKIAKDLKCDYVAAIDSSDVTLLAVDGFHPGPKIYDHWAEQVYQVIKSRFY